MAHTTPGSVSLAASASDPDATVAWVDFYANGTFIDSDASAPYALSWSPAAGTFSLTARAYDRGGNTATSPAIRVHTKRK